MTDKSSFLDALRDEYETVQHVPSGHGAVEEFNVIDARMRKSYKWLEKAVTYLNGIKSPIKHRFDLGHGLVFEAPRFGRGVLGQHSQSIRGFPVIDEISLYYHVCASKLVSAEMSTVDAELMKKAVEAANLQYDCRRIRDADGVVRKCVVSVPQEIPSAVVFRTNYRSGVVTITLTNADRFDRVSLALQSNAIKEQLLEDLLKFILGLDRALLRHAQLAGISGRPGS
jgi:hypothetical protein